MPASRLPRFTRMLLVAALLLAVLLARGGAREPATTALPGGAALEPQALAAGLVFAGAALSARGPAEGVEAADATAGDATAVWQLTGDPPHPGFERAVGGLRPRAHGLRLAPDVGVGLAVGDALWVSLPGIVPLPATIDWIEARSGDRLALSAVLDGLGDGYTLTLTRGRSALFARVTTPWGSFLVEATGGAGALAEDTLDELIDTDIPDALLPEALLGDLS